MDLTMHNVTSVTLGKPVFLQDGEVSRELFITNDRKERLIISLFSHVAAETKVIQSKDSYPSHNY